MIINVGSEIEGFTRYNGGWIKTVESLDKSYKNGYSLVGEFLPVSSGNIDLKEDELYLDCSIGGSRKNKEKDYHLFKVIDGEVFVIKTIEDGGNDWAMSLWETVEKELELENTDKVDTVLRKIKHLDDHEFFQMMEELRKNDKRFQALQYLVLEDFIRQSVEAGTLDQTVEQISEKYCGIKK